MNDDVTSYAIAFVRIDVGPGVRPYVERVAIYSAPVITMHLHRYTSFVVAQAMGASYEESNEKVRNALQHPMHRWTLPLLDLDWGAA